MVMRRNNVLREKKIELKCKIIELLSLFRHLRRIISNYNTDRNIEYKHLIK